MRSSCQFNTLTTCFVIAIACSVFSEIVCSTPVFSLLIFFKNTFLRRLTSDDRHSRNVPSDMTVLLSPVYTIQPVVKPVVKPIWQPVVSCMQTFNRLSNPFDNWFDKPAVSCIQPVVKPVVQPGLTTGWTNSGCSFTTVVKPVVKPVWQATGCLFTRYSHFDRTLARHRAITYAELCIWVAKLQSWHNLAKLGLLYLTYSRRLEGNRHIADERETVIAITKQVVKVIWQKGHITNAHGRFSRTRQAAPMCTRT